jgi:mannosyl-3-phosphoglycerate synthase
MDIDTMRFSHILEADGLYDLNYFFAHTAFVIAHKSESLETLLGVIWYLPVNSPILIVTNCLEAEKEELEQGLASRLAQYRQVYLIHQKDAMIARFFAHHEVYNILGTDGKVVNGKGEGMYIGALIASLLGFAEWIVFYDADNFVPNALLEYTLAMSKLFLQERAKQTFSDQSHLQNVRICWSSKPSFGNDALTPGIAGRCTRVVSPLMTSLVTEWFGLHTRPIISSNAGEQGFTMETIRKLRFSSRYSVETFQLLDLFSKTFFSSPQEQPQRVILQQYQAQSPHFHEKRDDEHIKHMIAESLGGFFHFKEYLPACVEQQLQQVYEEMKLDFCLPVVYPPLEQFGIERNDAFVNQYRLSDLGSALPEQEALCG